MATSPTSFQALGLAFEFESDDHDLADLVQWCYRDLPPATGVPGLIRASVVGDRFAVTYCDPEGGKHVCEPSVTPGGVLDVITWEVNDRATSTASLAIVHAAVTAGSNGAVVLHGASHAGKSTIAAGAARRGWGHLSDDLAPIDASTLTVHPYARPIMLRAGGREVVGGVPEPAAAHRRFLDENWFFPASALGAQTVTATRPLVATVELVRGESTELAPVSKAAALHALLTSSLTVVDRGAAEFVELERVAVAVPGYRLTVADLDEALDAVGTLLGAG